MNMKVTIQPAALWMYFMFNTLQKFATKVFWSTRYQVDVVNGSGL